jgi:DNA-binding beta-propeller fold protein YncE
MAINRAGNLSKGIAFSPDGRYVYVGNWGEQNLATYQLKGDKLVPVGAPLKLPGHPVSMRSSTP